MTQTRHHIGLTLLMDVSLIIVKLENTKQRNPNHTNVGKANTAARPPLAYCNNEYLREHSFQNIFRILPRKFCLNILPPLCQSKCNTRYDLGN